MKIGIIGPPSSGKTSLFKILVQANTTGDIGVFKLVDERLDKLSDIYSSKKKTYSELTFIDIGNISESNHSKLQDIDLFICVIGTFFSPDPKKDLESYITDIILSDLEAVQGRIQRIEKERMKIKTDVDIELQLLKRCQDFLSDGKFLYKQGLTKDELKLFSGFEFITLRSIVVAVNIQEKEEDKINLVKEYCSSIGVEYIKFLGKVELELLDLQPEERAEFSKGMGLEGDFRKDMSSLILNKLNLITFFTAREKEAKAWHLANGLPIIEAAGKIHSDIKRGFIKAEVVNYNDFSKCDFSMQKVREAGLLKVEGKEYVVKDADILNIRFNV